MAVDNSGFLWRPENTTPNSIETLGLSETFDHGQPAIRSSLVPERPSSRVRWGWTKLQHGAERQGGTDLTPVVIYV